MHEFAVLGQANWVMAAKNLQPYSLTIYIVLNTVLVFSRFNYRSTHYMVKHGFYNFLNWFDERAWYPLGRIVGGTVSIVIIWCHNSGLLRHHSNGLAYPMGCVYVWCWCIVVKRLNRSRVMSEYSYFSLDGSKPQKDFPTCCCQAQQFCTSHLLGSRGNWLTWFLRENNCSNDIFVDGYMLACECVCAC